jgi:hypothetical protein
MSVSSQKIWDETNVGEQEKKGHDYLECGEESNH